MPPSAFNRRTNTMAQKKKAYTPKKKGALFGGLATGKKMPMPMSGKKGAC